MKRCVLVVAVGLVGMWIIGPGAVSAQECCRLTTDPTAGLECNPDSAVPRLQWRRSCLRYGFGQGTLQALTANSEDASVSRRERLTPERVRQVFQESFDEWLSATCAGGRRTAFYVEQLAEELPVTEASFEFGEPNEMVVLAHTGEVWEERNYDSAAFAQTSIWHNSRTGQIYDVDIEINLARGPYAACEAPCVRDAVDLGNTITHEVGHLFGLAHASIRASTMYRAAAPGEILKRNLLPSDAACFCDTYPAGSLPENHCSEAAGDCECGPPPIYQATAPVGCACSLLGQSAAGGWTSAAPFAIALWGLAWSRRRARRRTRTGS